ncbi:MAG: zf-TFIIB domain-containing protein [Planctomycetaceae bacterium]|nr:zf-TFIIB domain-containing protein [Planctomycetaceae bacterium]
MITYTDRDWIEESESRQPRQLSQPVPLKIVRRSLLRACADECRRLKKKLVSVEQSIPGEIIAMNCSNCGAPLSPTVHQRSLLCEYCRSHRHLTDDLVSDEGVVDLNHPGDHDCPTCHTPLHRGLMEEAQIEHCPRCCGLLLPGDLFREVVHSRRAVYSGADDKPAPVDPVALKTRRDCPTCHQRMDTHPYYGPGNTVIDSCSRCDLIWLDAGEMTALVRAPGRRGW